MVLHAALLLNENDLYEELLDELRKAYVHLIPKGDSDIQIDIYYCVRFYGSTRRKYWGADETRLSEGLKSLEKRIYFLTIISSFTFLPGSILKLIEDFDLLLPDTSISISFGNIFLPDKAK